MANNKKRQCNFCVPFCKGMPSKIVDRAVVLILTCTVVGMQVNFCLPETVVLEEIMELADNNIGTLAAISCLISKEVYLSRYGFTVDSEDTAFSWCKEVEGSRLEGV